MRQSSLVTKTSKETSKEEPSRNAQLLVRAGFINRLMAGVYSFLPLGNRVLQNIEQIVREEMNGLGAQEILMPALHPREIWDKTGRWDKVDVLFRFKGQGDRDLCLGPTHEEVVTPLVGNFIRSYRDLPTAVYQIQTKFRNEVRAKSGLLRGREFRMKDLYSFHTSLEDLDQYYERAIEAYKRVFVRCGLGERTVVTFASGGIFSKYSHEFQTITEYGEDVVFRVPGKDLAINRELIEDEEVLSELVPTDSATGKRMALEELKSIEVGNIFKLGSRFSDAFGLSYLDAAGARQPIYMGCYGIGPSRVMGTIAEVLGDERGLSWPKEVAPFAVHLVSLCQSAEETAEADKIYQALTEAGIETLYDDRTEIQAGAKFADSDLLGLPWRVVVSKKTLAQNKVELKARTESSAELVELSQVIGHCMSR